MSIFKEYTATLTLRYFVYVFIEKSLFVSKTYNLITCRGHSNVISDASFSNDERILATASWDKSIQLWDVSSGSYRFSQLYYVKYVKLYKIM